MRIRVRKIVLAAAALGCFAGAAKEPVDWVNVEIGNISHLLVPTFPTIQRPNGMLRFLPPNESFTVDRVRAFHLLTPAHRAGGVFRLTPCDGPFTWDQQEATPYSYKVFLDSLDMTVAFAPGEKAALFEFGFERAGAHVLRLAPVSKDGRLTAEGNVVRGWDVYRGVKIHLRAEFQGATVTAAADGRGVAADFGTAPCAGRMRYAVSFISQEQAARNLAREAGDWDFDRLAREARAAWNAKLGKIDVTGGTDDEKTVFYTSLYRCYERMVNVTEDGRYLGWDGQVHATDGVDHYTDDWVWDTFRAHHPLMCLLEPEAEGAKLQSYVRMARQNAEKWMPTFPDIAGDRHCMNGHHATAIFLDAHRKGITGFDLRAAYAALVHTERTESAVPWLRGPYTELDVFLREKGWMPALREGEQETVKGPTAWEKRQAVAVTQAASYDAWCIREIGKAVGAPAEEIAEFDRRAGFFRNLWKADTGFFHPKDKDGKWIEPFDYRFSGGIGSRAYYDENNAWTYVWNVPHAIPELVGLLGGPAAAAAKLERQFNEPLGCRSFEWPAVQPDSSAMMGQFSMGNEPSFHIPYMFNRAGQPWKTQKLVRKLVKAWFRNDLMGIPGDEDGGGMCAFVVFTMLGFYPMTPGLPEYEIGSPFFTRAAIRGGAGTEIVLEAPAASERNKYVRRVTVDGRPLAGTSIPHAALAGGARVVFEMSDRPARGKGRGELEAWSAAAFDAVMRENFSPKTSLIYAGDPAGSVRTAKFHPYFVPSENGGSLGGGMEDCAITGGVALSMLVDRWEATRAEALKDLMRAVATGLLNLERNHGVRGFVARGLCSDDAKSICVSTSRDQVTHFIHGLWRYVRTGVCPAAMRAEIAAAFANVADRMERNCTAANGWDFLAADGSRDGRQKMWEVCPHESARLPMVYLAAHALTGREKYRALYLKYADAALDETLKLKTDAKKYAGLMPAYTFLQAQSSLEVMRELDGDPARAAKTAEAMRTLAELARRRAEGLKGGDERWLCAPAEYALTQLMCPGFAFTAEQEGYLAVACRAPKSRSRTGNRRVELAAAVWRLARRELK